ncbi:MAG: hypothetical protein WD690_06290 [Vicinamibacterales bacterium]
MAIAGLTIVALAVRFENIGRAGLSPDEPLTWLAIAGIDAHGLPLLPSGVLYERGLLYSFAAWLAGEAAGHRIEVYRAVSAASGAFLPALVYLVLRPAGMMPALAVALPLAVHPTLVVTSAWARFYGPATIAAVVALYAMRTAADGSSRRWAMASIAAATLLHEYAAVLALFPLALWASATDPHFRRQCRRLLVMTVLVFALTMAAVLVVKRMLPGLSGSAAEHGLTVQLAHAFRSTPPPLAATAGAIAAIVSLACIAVPPKARRFLLAGAAAVAALVLTHTASLLLFTDTPFSWRLPLQMLRVSMVYPWAAWWFLPRVDPAILLLIAATAISAILIRPTDRNVFGRAVLLLLLATLFLYGVIEMGFVERYLSLLYAPAAIAAIAIWDVSWSRASRAAAGLAAFLLAWSAATTIGRPVFIGGSDTPKTSWDVVRTRLPGKTLICSDDLACSYFLRIPDVWLAAAGSDRDSFAVPTGGGLVSAYTGADVTHTIDQIDRIAATSSGGVLIVVAAGRFDFPAAEALVRLALRRHQGTALVDGPRFLAIEVFPLDPPEGRR